MFDDLRNSFALAVTPKNLEKNANDLLARSTVNLKPQQETALSLFLQGWDHEEMAEEMRMTRSGVEKCMGIIHDQYGVRYESQLLAKIYGPVSLEDLGKISELFDLSERQTKALGHILEGKKRKEVAELLGTKSSSLRTVLDGINEKMRTKSPAEIFFVAHRFIHAQQSANALHDMLVSRQRAQLAEIVDSPSYRV